MAIEPLRLIESTNLREHNQIINKLNEVVDGINGFDPNLQTYDRATIDTKDDTVLQLAKDYADSVIPEHDCYTKSETDAKDTIVLNDAKVYADTKDALVLNNAKAYADTKQSVLVAGTGININGNVISAEPVTGGSGNLSALDFTDWVEVVNCVNTGLVNGKQAIIYGLIPKVATGLAPRNMVTVNKYPTIDSTIFNYSINEYNAGGGMTMFVGAYTHPNNTPIGGSMSIPGYLVSFSDAGQMSFQELTEILPASNYVLLYKEV